MTLGEIKVEALDRVGKIALGAIRLHVGVSQGKRHCVRRTEHNVIHAALVCHVVGHFDIDTAEPSHHRILKEL